jgi:hypothetical protein
VRKLLKVLLFFSVIALATPIDGFAAQIARYSIVTSSRVIGGLSAVSKGNRVRLVYSTKDNGRGPSSDEDITLYE